MSLVAFQVHQCLFIGQERLLLSGGSVARRLFASFSLLEVYLSHAGRQRPSMKTDVSKCVVPAREELVPVRQPVIDSQLGSSPSSCNATALFMRGAKSFKQEVIRKGN